MAHTLTQCLISKLSKLGFSLTPLKSSLTAFILQQKDYYTIDRPNHS